MNLGVLHFGHANRKDTNVARRNGTYMAVQPPTGHFLLLTLRITKSYPLKREFSLFKHNKTELPRFNTDSSRLEQQQPCTRISVRHWFGISSELPKSRRVRSYSVFSSDRQVIFFAPSSKFLSLYTNMRSRSVDHRLRCWSSTGMFNYVWSLMSPANPVDMSALLFHIPAQAISDWRVVCYSWCFPCNCWEFSCHLRVHSN